MRERCPDTKLVGKFKLEGYKLAFTIYSPKRLCGCADIIKSHGDEVWGLVYELTDSDMQKLDGYEGHPRYYKRITVNVVDEVGMKKEVETYEVSEKSKQYEKPSREYLDIIIHAANEYNFPESYKKVINAFQTLD